MTDLTIPSKHCVACGEEKPLSSFSRGRGKPDGLQYTCKACDRIRAQERMAQRRAEMGDEAWRAHQAETMRRRRTDPEKREADRRHNRAVDAAMAALRDMYPDTYRALLRIERSKLGLDPGR